MTPPSDPPTTLTGTGVDAPGVGSNLEPLARGVGARLLESLGALLAAIPGHPHRPQALATRLGVDKVLTSRLLKALRGGDPIEVLAHAPGPDPLRRVLRSARRVGVGAVELDAARDAIDAFEGLIRDELGDRSALATMVAAWLPAAREEFELRRKQAAYKAISQLKGVTANLDASAVVLHPGASGDRLDVLWCMGLFGLRRLRPDARVKFATRRLGTQELNAGPRRPMNLAGIPVDGIDRTRLDAYCSQPTVPLVAHRYGDVVHYTLGGESFGPGSGVDLVFAELNLDEMSCPKPPDPPRSGFVFAEVGTPSRSLSFDVFVHEDVYGGIEPELVLHDTAIGGVADPFDPARDIDRLEMIESLDFLGRGLERCSLPEAPKHRRMLEEVFAARNWDPREFRAYRVRIEYPIYGSQVTVAFAVPQRGGATSS